MRVISYHDASDRQRFEIVDTMRQAFQFVSALQKDNEPHELWSIASPRGRRADDVTKSEFQEIYLAKVGQKTAAGFKILRASMFVDK